MQAAVCLCYGLQQSFRVVADWKTANSEDVWTILVHY